MKLNFSGDFCDVMDYAAMDTVPIDWATKNENNTPSKCNFPIITKILANKYFPTVLMYTKTVKERHK